MYPFHDSWRWWLSGRVGHLAAMAQGARVEGARVSTTLAARTSSLLRWNRVRTVTGVLLSLGAVATAISLVATWYGPAQALIPASRGIASVGGTLTGVMGAGYLLSGRILGILEVNILGLLAANKSIR
ncbi:MAG: hypothetical protein ACYDBQ_00185 [Thermoplasmatota archaeon]